MFCGSSQGKRRHCKKDVDHISNLPDTILCYILSFLTTTSAVKTSILSKRWKYVWTKVPALDFTDVLDISSYISLSLGRKICFKRFMDYVLLHNDASYVHRFCLQNFDVDAFFVNSWLNATSRCEMHELNVSFKQYLDVCLLPRFLLSEKLVVLKLHRRISIDPSVSFHLPSLETIHLTTLELPNDEFMKKLSSSCPVLRELHIVFCAVKGTTLCVESLALKSLLMKYNRTIHGLLMARTVIKTPNLSYLCLHEYMGSSIDIEDMSSLVEADLLLDSNQVEKLFKNVYGIKTLRVRSNVLRHVKNLPVFPNLTWLKYEADSFISFEALNCAPKLKWLFLPYHEFSDFLKPEAAPEHLSFLESVEICCFTGLAKEIDTAAYFLRAASALKEMKITFSILRPCDVTSAYQRLLDLPRSSAVCRIKITN